MRRVVYSVAMSLDGFIAGPGGEYDWIPADVGIDWGAFLGRFDTALLGRRTYEVMAGGPAWAPHMPTYVFSRTLRATDHPSVELVGEGASATVRELRQRPGRDIWLMGGGVLFRSFLEQGLVDVVEVAIVPVLLGVGLPFLPGLADRQPLTLTAFQQLSGGLVLLTYDVATDATGVTGDST